jgi:hypothetical protein
VISGNFACRAVAFCDGKVDKLRRAYRQNGNAMNGMRDVEGRPNGPAQKLQELGYELGRTTVRPEQVPVGARTLFYEHTWRFLEGAQ